VAQPFKDRFFQRPFFERLADEVAKVYPAFDRARFFAGVYDGAWDGLELKGRMRHASEALGAVLPPDFRQAVAILLKVERHFDGFDHLLCADFVERFGVDDFDTAVRALEVFTRTSAEFAIRPFLRRYPDQAFAQMRAWAGHESEHVRRLSSEGCRPRLPWGTALEELKRDPSPILPILEALKDDASEYVRRSVANNLGDIAKDHPGPALDLGERWIAEDASRRPMVKHGLRDLLKKGNRRALTLFGVGETAKVAVETLAVAPARVPLGGDATLRVTLRSTAKKAQRLRLEYAMTYARPSGRTGRKVFKIADADVAAGARLDLTRKLSFADRSIRTHYAGPHVLSLIVNGHALGEAAFHLVPAGKAAGRRTRAAVRR
jgi:3-methyladenine DNA glycosylase AlkC